MDIAKLKRNRGRLSGFIMGLIASIYGGMFAMLSVLSTLTGTSYQQFSEYRGDTATLIGILVIVTSAISIVGASLVRGKRIAGGIILIMTGVPLFIISVIDTFAFFPFLLTGLVCVAAGILALIPLSDNYFQRLAAKHQYEKHMNAFIAQQQTRQDGGAVTITPVINPAQIPPSDDLGSTEKQNDNTHW